MKYKIQAHLKKYIFEEELSKGVTSYHGTSVTPDTNIEKVVNVGNAEKPKAIKSELCKII